MESDASERSTWVATAATIQALRTPRTGYLGRGPVCAGVPGKPECGPCASLRESGKSLILCPKEQYSYLYKRPFGQFRVIYLYKRLAIMKFSVIVNYNTTSLNQRTALSDAGKSK